jgi:hypothetical protein
MLDVRLLLGFCFLLHCNLCNLRSCNPFLSISTLDGVCTDFQMDTHCSVVLVPSCTVGISKTASDKG